MQGLNNYSFDEWAHFVEAQFNVEEAKRPSLPLHEIVWTFKQNMKDDSNSSLEERRDLAEKVKILSEEKIQYYRSSRFGFIIEFFSSLRNAWVVGSFKSSGQLGLEESQDFLDRSQGVQDFLETVEDVLKEILFDPKDQITQSEPAQREQEQEEVVYEEHQESMIVVDVEKDELVNIQECYEEEQTTVLEEQPMSEEIDMKAPQSPKEEMLETLDTIWQHADKVERNDIKKIWALMLQPAQVLSWKPTGKSNEYQLELKEEIFGSHSEIPMGQFIIKQKMKIVFSEEKIDETDNYRQMILFPDQGLCLRMGMSWLSKDFPIERILIEENRQGEIQCTVEALGKKLARSINDTFTFWKKVQWNS